MRPSTPITAIVFTLVMAGWAAAQPGGGPPRGVPDLDGRWYMNGDPDKPTLIEQRSDEAVFTNEKGERARGTIERDRVWIPEWSDGRRRGSAHVLPPRWGHPDGCTRWRRPPQARAATHDLNGHARRAANPRSAGALLAAWIAAN